MMPIFSGFASPQKRKRSSSDTFQTQFRIVPRKGAPMNKIKAALEELRQAVSEYRPEPATDESEFINWLGRTVQNAQRTIKVRGYEQGG
jgi:hypothetical protein